MATQSIGVRIALEGASEYIRDLKTATAETKALKSELELASRLKNPFERASSMKGILTSEIAAQEEKIKLLTEAYNAAEESTGKFSEKTLKARDALDKAEIALDSMKKQLSNLPNGLEMAGDDLLKTGEKISSVGKEFNSVGRTFLPITGAVAASFGASAKAAVQFESDFNGVMKTVEASEGEYAALSDWIKEYSRTIGVSKSEIAETMQIVGQLGVRGVENIEAFTKTAIEMGEATDWTSAEAADAMARFMNIFSTPKDKVADLGNVIVGLGNNIATTEPEIGEMAVRLASASKMAGLTEEQVLALAASMSSVGINAEAGGSAMSKVLTTIAKSVEMAGTSFDSTGAYAEKLELLGTIAGMTGEEFKRAWGEDTIGTLLTFIEHLDNAERTGSSALVTLDELGMKEIRVSNALRSLTLASDEVYRAQKIANQEISNGSALTDEASIRWGEYSHRIEAAKQGIENVGISIGERLLPYIEKGIDFVQKMVDKWDALSPSMQETIVKTVALTAAISPLAFAIGGIFTGIGSIISVGGHLFKGTGKLIHLLSGAGGMASATFTVRDGFGALLGAIGSGATGLIGGIGKLAAAAAPFLFPHGLVVAGILAAGIAIFKNWGTIKQGGENLVGWLKGQADAIITAALGFTYKALKWGFDLVANIGKGIWNGMKTVWDAVVGVGKTIKSLLGHSTPDEGPLKNDDEWMGHMMQNFISGIDKKVPALGQSAEAASNAIKTGILGGTGTIGSELESSMSKAVNAVASAEPRLVSAAQSMATKMSGAFKTMAESAKTWGADLIKSMASGIQSHMSTVASAANNAAAAVKKRLGFSEPEEGPLSDFHTYMPDMMALMAKGIRDNIPVLRDAVNQAAYAMLPPTPYMDLPDTGYNSNTTNMGGVQIVINQQPGQDADELAEILEQKLVALEERRLYAYGTT